MTAHRLTDAQIATALRAHLPAHARSDVRGRITAEVASSRQSRPFAWVFGSLTDADPDVRRRAVLLAAAALLLVGAAVALTVGALLRRSDPVRLTVDPAVNADGFVLQAYVAHAALPAMTLVARMWDLNEGPVDVQRFVFDGGQRVRHECCDGTILIQTPEFYGSLTRVNENEAYFVVGPPRNVAPGFELKEYNGFGTPDCQAGWRYLGSEVIVARQAHHLACAREPQGGVVLPDFELWLDAELGIALHSRTWGIQMDAENKPVSAYGSEMLVESIVFGPPPADAFEPPPGMAVITPAELNCKFDPNDCASPEPQTTEAPGVTPLPAASTPDPPDIPALVASTLASYADPPAMSIEIEGRGGARDRRRSTDGEGRIREEYAFDAPDGPTIDLGNEAGFFESWPLPGHPDDWVRLGDAFTLSPDEFTLGLPATCNAGWTYVGLDALLGAEAWHIGCEGDEYWIDRELLLVVRKLSKPDLLQLTFEVETVVRFEVGPQPPELFQLPEEAVIRDR